MNRRIALSLSLLSLAAACGYFGSDKSGQTTKAAARTDSVPLATSKTDPGGGAAAVKGALSDQGTKTPARPPATPAGSGAPASNAAPAAELQSAPQIFTVQVASYLNASTAAAQRARLLRAGVPAWTTTATVGGQEFTRVRVGGSTTDAGARAVAAKLRATYHWPVWVTRVENRSALPADVLTTTRTYAGGT